MVTEQSETESPLEEWQVMARGSFGVSYWEIEGRTTVRASERMTHEQTFHLTPDERRRNQKLCRDKRDDPFTNGAFKMLACVAGDKDSETLWKVNDVKLDDDLAAMLDFSMQRFTVGVKKMKDVVSVDRLYRMARQNEIGGKKMALIMDKLRELDSDVVLVGDSVAAGREDPDNTPDGPAVNVEGDGPREYAGMNL